MIQGLTLSDGFRSRAAKLLRLGAAGLMLATTFGPFPDAARPVAEAKNLQWGFMRPILTTEADSTDTNGYDFLPTYGNVLHAIAVAPNGDVFTAGQDGTTTTIYKSTDKGAKWRASILSGFPASALVRQIVISPDYPSDDFVAVVFSDDDGVASEAADGVGFSTDEGLSFTVAFDGADGLATATMALTEWGTIALSPDFNWNDGLGSIAVGGELTGAGTASVWKGTTAGFKVSTANAAGFAPMTTGGGPEAAPINTLHLAYNNDESPITLARLVSTPLVTVGHVTATNDWSLATAANTIVAAAAQAGQVAFDDDYELDGVFFAAVSTGVTCPAANCGGTFKWTGTWVNETNDEGPCAGDTAALSVAGNGAATQVVSALNATVTNLNVTCRSSNNAATFSDNEADGGSDAIQRIDPPATASHVRVAGHRNDPTQVYWTSAGNLGGLAVSTNGGSSWRDGSLTNQTYRINHTQEIDASIALARAVDSGGNTSIWRTTNHGQGAAWTRVERAPNINSTIESPTPDIKYVSRAGEGDNRLIKSSDGGLTWFATSANPVDNEEIRALASSGASIVMVGTDEGRVYRSEDGGASWNAIVKDFGSIIDEFDITSDPATWFVTAFQSDFKVWVTKDSGATFTLIGTSPWGTGQGSIDLQAAGWNPATDTGYLMVRTSGATSTDDVFRMVCPCTTGTPAWEELDIDAKTFTSSFVFSTPGVGEGRLFLLSGGGFDGLQYSVTAGTMDKFDIDESQTSASTGNERANPLFLLPDPPAGSAGCSASGVISTHRSLTGVNIQFNGGGGTPGCGQIRELTLSTAFTSGPPLTSPIGGVTVPTNVGADGLPVLFRWNEVPAVAAYDVLVGLLPDLSDGTLFADVGTELLFMTGALYPLVPGLTYHWTARASKIRNETGSANVEGESPWAPIATFNVVSPGSPPPSDGGLGGTNLKISTGKPSAGAVNLSWDEGSPVGGFRVHRTDFFTSTTVLLPPGGPLPGNATSYFDTSAAANTLYCYFVTPLSATGDAIAASDTECAMTGVKNGTVPADFTLSLGQSTTTTLTWKPPAGGVDNFLLVVVPLGGGASSSVALSGVTRGISREEATTGPTCYLLAGLKGAAVGNTELLCSVPGLSTFANEDGLVVTPPGAPNRPNRPNQGALDQRTRDDILQWRSAVNGDAAAVLRMIGNAFGSKQPNQRGGR